MLLDVYGTDHDPRAWESPEEFHPERHGTGRDTRFALVAQGGVDPSETHRCAGEHATIEIMKRVARLFASSLEHDLPPQDLTIDMTRIPAMVRSGLRMRHVRWHMPAEQLPRQAMVG